MPTIPGLAGPLEILFRAAEAPRAAHLPAAALVCHPHPAHGGTMHNKVVYSMARALLGCGIDVLRFNFRGVGASAGPSTSQESGQGEREDIRTCLDWLGERYPEQNLLLAGFSFGAWNGLTVAARDARVTQLVLAGLPVGTYSRPPFEPGKPVLLLHGENDAFGTPEQLAACVADWASPCETIVFKGADHFFGGLDSARSAGRLPELESAIHEHLRIPPVSFGPTTKRVYWI